jgi:hypothetical protein
MKTGGDGRLPADVRSTDAARHRRRARQRGTIEIVAEAQPRLTTEAGIGTCGIELRRLIAGARLFDAQLATDADCSRWYKPCFPDGAVAVIERAARLRGREGATAQIVGVTEARAVTRRAQRLAADARNLRRRVARGTAVGLSDCALGAEALKRRRIRRALRGRALSDAVPCAIAANDRKVIAAAKVVAAEARARRPFLWASSAQRI